MAPPPQELETTDGMADARQHLVREQLRARDLTDARVLAAMNHVPRHEFVLPAYRTEAYGDYPLPIIGGQTISQPYIVAFMTQAANLEPTARCLEIGTGSGYQTAVLAELCQEVYSIEYLPDVAEFGRNNLQRTGYIDRGVRLRTGDGYLGWPEAAPFDAIIVTAAPERIPPALLTQLALGGKLVIPVGPSDGVQQLQVVTRTSSENDPAAFDQKVPFGVRFVPFLGNH